VRKSLILIGAVAIVILGIFLILVAAGRPAGPPITIRHVKSIPSGDTTTLIFEISNHTANSYVFFASAVEVHSGTAPSYRFPNNHPPRTLGPSSFITYPEAMIVPKGVPLRFRISANKRLTGPEGFVARVQLSIFFTIAGLPRPFSLNPFDNKGDVFGPSIGVDSEEFEESPKNQAER
jgi:hypothetical protein